MTTRLTFGPFEIDGGAQVVLRGGDILPIGQRGVMLLQTLLSRPGEVLTKSELIDAAWGGAAVACAAAGAASTAASGGGGVSSVRAGAPALTATAAKVANSSVMRSAYGTSQRSRPGRCGGTGRLIRSPRRVHPSGGTCASRSPRPAGAPRQRDALCARQDAG